MLELLLYSGIHCIDAVDMINRMQESDSVSEAIKAELVEVIQEATPDCNWDAND
jgi:hypothetical protein|tara:strand:+ start:34 stop:195 length:162 start_codon:yes stop_codon:yes gene_type:complete